jgi:hypothetical protein
MPGTTIRPPFLSLGTATIGDAVQIARFTPIAVRTNDTTIHYRLIPARDIAGIIKAIATAPDAAVAFDVKAVVGIVVDYGADPVLLPWTLGYFIVMFGIGISGIIFSVFILPFVIIISVFPLFIAAIP